MPWAGRVLASWEDHDGYDGVVFGLGDVDRQLVRHREAAPSPTTEDRLAEALAFGHRRRRMMSTWWRGRWPSAGQVRSHCWPPTRAGARPESMPTPALVAAAQPAPELMVSPSEGSPSVVVTVSGANSADHRPRWWASSSSPTATACRAALVRSRVPVARSLPRPPMSSARGRARSRCRLSSRRARTESWPSAHPKRARRPWGTPRSPSRCWPESWHR